MNRIHACMAAGLLLLTGCGGGAPTEADVEKACLADVQASEERLAKLFRKPVSETQLPARRACCKSTAATTAEMSPAVRSFVAMSMEREALSKSGGDAGEIAGLEEKLQKTIDGFSDKDRDDAYTVKMQHRSCAKAGSR